jgi:cell wall-associated NlpC family hydrolase
MPGRPTATSIDEYIAAFPPQTREALRQVREAIRAAAPGAAETISYAVPTFDMDGRHLVHFAGYDRHLGFYPTAGGIAVDWALAQVGTPYIWGGESPGVGFDCSGLVQAAYKVAGISLPRVAQDQFDAGPQLPPGAPLEPGDLVFFGDGPGAVDHVGLVVSPGVMVDAPYTGADVREDTFPTTVGAAFGDMEYLGAT